MSIKISTGLRNQMLATNPLRSILAGGFLKIYSGPVPGDADAAISGSNTLLCTISVNSGGTGLSFDSSAVNGTIVKDPAQIWSGNNVASGIATFYRHVTASDTGGSSTSEPRIQGEIGLAGSDMVLSNTTLVNGAPQTVDYYAVNLPAMA